MNKLKINKEDDELVIRFPYYTKRSNPYMDENCDCGKHKTICGLVITNKEYDKIDDGYMEYGLAYVIDMDYKDKGDQCTSIVINLKDELNDVGLFEKECKRLGLDIFYINY